MVDLDNSRVLYGEMAHVIHENKAGLLKRQLIARIDDNSEEFTKRLCQNNEERRRSEIHFLNNGNPPNHNVFHNNPINNRIQGGGTERSYGLNGCSTLTTENAPGVYDMLTEMLKDGVTLVNGLENEQSNLETPIHNNKQNWKEFLRSMQEIIPGLFLGPYHCATKSHLQSLLENGITHIVCVRQDEEAHFIRPNFLETFKYMVVELSDSEYESIIPHFTAVRKFLEDCRSQGGKVLIHGNNGVSRSAALVLAYVMEECCFTYKEAFKFVQARRFCIQPNNGFIAQLKEFEPILKARRTFQFGQSSGNQRNKRQLDTEDEDIDYIPLPPPPSPVNGLLSGSTEFMDIGCS